MPSTQPIKRNHFIKLHWLEILACRNLHGSRKNCRASGAHLPVRSKYLSSP
jgi:hypothetical protein